MMGHHSDRFKQQFCGPFSATFHTKRKNKVIKDKVVMFRFPNLIIILELVVYKEAGEEESVCHFPTKYAFKSSATLQNNVQSIER
jgi:hypothetical protein